MALSTSFTWAEAYDCGTFYFTDTTTFGTGGNPAAGAITSTIITLTSNSGNIYTYEDYLPTQGTKTLVFADFTPDEDNATVSTDCTCCMCPEEETVTTFEDGCWSIQYEQYVDTDRVGSSTDELFFYCIARNRIFAWIEGSCDDCCDREVQYAINEAITTYNNMLIVFNKGRGCSCTTKQLTRLQKQLDNLDNDCDSNCAGCQ